MATTQADIQNKIKNIKELSDEELEIIVAEEIKQSSEEDLESLLKLAEELNEKVYKPENKVKYLRYFQLFYITLLIVFYLFDYFEILRIPQSPTLNFFMAFLVILTIILAENMIRMLRNKILPDKFALKEVLQLLREVHGTIAEREDWSILKRAEFRIRLSRFDLSEKKESVFSFFS